MVHAVVPVLLYPRSLAHCSHYRRLPAADIRQATGQHFRKGLPELGDSLRRHEIVMHPFVVGELACGKFSNRQATLELLQQLRSIDVAEHDEVMNFIRVRKLHGRGIGYVDVHLLAAAAIAGCRLWTVDKRLEAVASSLGIAR